MSHVKSFRFLAFLLAGAIFLSFSCNRRNDVWDGELITSVDHTFAEAEFASLTHLVDLYARSDSNLYGETPIAGGFYCPAFGLLITEPATGLTNVVFDFGTGTNCMDGRTRSGRLNALYSGKWRNPGSTVTITPDEYSVAGYAFFFNLVATLNPDDANGNANWTTTISDAELINPNDGGRINWQSTRTTTWVQGEETFTYNDNIYEITGTSSGVARSLRSFTAETTTPVRIDIGCPTPVSGTVSISPDSLRTRTIDYGLLGPGSCDNTAVIRIDEFETEFNLR